MAHHKANHVQVAFAANAAARRPVPGYGGNCRRLLGPGRKGAVVDNDPQPHTGSVTIYDVATAASVAPSTVSRTFSRPGRVNAVTAERVRAAAASLGYRTSAPARALPGTLSRLVAFVVSDVTNPFYGQLIRGAQETVARAGYTMVLADTHESSQVERSSIERAIAAVDGIILAGSRMPDSAIRMIAKQKPVVVLNRAVTDVHSVVVDSPRGILRAATHLRELGHNHITYVAGPEASWADGIRWRSLLDVAGQLGITARRIGPFRPTIAGGRLAAERFAGHPTTAAMAYNDQLAIGLVRGLSRLGIQVPEDVSVIGFDNVPACKLVTPRLTTIAAPLRDEGVTAGRNLIAIIGGAQSRTGEPVVLPTRLVVRESTRPPGPRFERAESRRGES